MCLFWCLWKEMNNRKILRIGRGIWEIFFSMFFETLYLWTTAYVSPLSNGFSAFLFRFAFSS
jgi:hypothetical protein